MLLIMMCIVTASVFNFANGGLVYGRKMEGLLLKRIVREDLNECAKECWRRASCLSLNYNRLEKLCELNSMPITLDDLEQDTRWIFYYDVKSHDTIAGIGNCHLHACLPGQVCMTTDVGYDCINEGVHPSTIQFEQGVVNGNMNDEGSKISFECIPPYERIGQAISTYYSTSGWSDMPVCKLPGSCSKPSFITSSFLQILMVRIVTQNGNINYTKENISTTVQVGEVMEHSVIKLACTTTWYGTVSTNILCYDGSWTFSPGCTVADTSCELETSCSNSVTENCISNLCRCDVPTSYSYTQHTCVFSCQDGLASTFTRYEGIGVYNSNFDYHSDVSYNECLAICLMRADCIFFEYGDYQGMGCYIRLLALMNLIDYIDIWIEGAIYSRDCL
ncbi:hypothetical protein ACF0H5_012609 [Mactra antiquata]